MKKRVADILVELLVEHGITDCFAVVGGGAMHLDNALALNKDIHKYFNHHEQACAMAAEAYARVSGKMAAVCVTSGPGATNTVTGVVGAWQDSLPMIVLSGQVRYEISVEKSGLPLRYRGIQEYNVVPAVKHMTKYAVMLTDPLSIKREFVKAVKIAMDGRRGPVWLDIPLDVQSAVINEEDLYPELPEQVSVRNMTSTDIQEAYNLLKKAERPCILAGSGIISGDARVKFTRFVEKVKIPVIGGSWVSDIFYTDHPRYYGLSGNIGPRTGNFILQNADVILTLGNSLSFRQTGFQQEGFASNAKIIMVDADQYEAQKPGIRLAKFIHADIKDFFKATEERFSDLEGSSEWFSYCNHLKERFSFYEGAEGIDPDERVCAYYFWKKFNEMAPHDAIVALGNNSANSAKLQIGVSKKEQRVITNYTCGSMGYDLPAAIGTTVATGRTVYCITGDGSIMMNLQELQTIKHYGLPVKIIVFTNDGYNAFRQTCKSFFDGCYIGCNAMTGISFPDFHAVAEAFGFQYRYCHSNREIENGLQWIFDESGHLFLEIKQRLDDPVTPKVTSRLKENGTFETPALQDMYPFIDKDEYKKLMLW